MLTTKENSIVETYTYEIASSSTLSIGQTSAVFNVVQQSGSYIINADKARLSIAPILSNPGFSFQRIINLQR